MQQGQVHAATGPGTRWRGPVRDALDPDVLQRFAAGEDEAFAEVYRRYSGPMFCVALLRVLGRRDSRPRQRSRCS